MTVTNAGARSKPEEPSRFEPLILDLLTRFLATPESRIDSEIEVAIRQIAEFLGLDQGFLVQWGEDSTRPLPTHSWTEPGGSPAPLSPRIDLVPWVYRQATLGKIVVFSRADDLPQEAETDKEFFRGSGRKAFISLPMKIEGRIVGILAFESLSREIAWSDDILSRLRLIAEVFGSILDRKKKKTDLEDRLRFESLLAKVSARLVSLSPDQADSLIQEFLGLLCESFGLDRCSIWQRNTEDSEFVQLTHIYQSADGPPFEEAAHSEVLPDDGRIRLSRRDATPQMRLNLATIYPWVSRKLERGETIVISSLEDLPEEAARDKKSFQAFATKSNVTVPLFMRGKWLGILTFASMQEEKNWSEQQVQRFQIVADLLINTLARQRADRELRQSEKDLRNLAGRLIYAQEGERRRLARELHDDLSQRLAVLAIDIENLRQELTASPESLRRQCQTIQDQVLEVSRDIHGLSRRLHPSILDTLGLENAIRSECRSFAEREGVAVHFEAQAVPPDIHAEVALSIHRIVQEGLRNIAKHARATEAHVSLSAEGDAVHLRIQDDGLGFDPSRVRRRAGLGLASMDERVRLILGTVTVDSRPGKGTIINVRIPLGASPALETPSPAMHVGSSVSEA